MTLYATARDTVPYRQSLPDVWHHWYHGLSCNAAMSLEIENIGGIIRTCCNPKFSYFLPAAFSAYVKLLNQTQTKQSANF